MQIVRTLEERERFSRDKYEAARMLKHDSQECVQSAIQLLNDALNVRPTYVNALLFRASLTPKVGDYASALTDLTVAIQLERQSEDYRRVAAMHSSRAAVFFKLGRTLEGIQDLTHAIELEPDNGTWLFECGRAYMKKGNILFAQQYFLAALHDKAVSGMSDGARYKTLRNLGLCRLQTAASETEMVEEGAFATSSATPLMRTQGGFGGMASASQAIRLAAATFAKAQELYDTAEIHSLLGTAFYKDNSLTLALTHFQRAVEMDLQKLEYYIDLGVCAFQLGHLEDALRCFTEAISRRGASPELFFFRASTFVKLRGYSDALRDLNTAIQMDPQPRYYFARGFVFASNGTSSGAPPNDEDAISGEQSDLEYDTSEDDGELELSSSALSSTALTERAALAKAAANYTKALNANPALRPCLVHLGLMAHRTGRLHNALHHLHAALVLTPMDATLVERIGLVYVDLGLHDHAARYFDRCCVLAPKNGKYHLRKAIAKVSEGDAYGALQSLSTAMDVLGVVSVAAMHTRAVVLLRLEKYEEAAVWARKASEAATAAAHNCNVYSDEEQLLLQPEQEEDEYEDETAESGNWYAKMLNRAEIQFCLENYDACVKDATEAIRLCEARSNCRAVQQRVAKRKEGNARSPIEGLPEAYYLRARAHHALDMLPEALADLTKASDLIPALSKTHTFCYAYAVLLANNGSHAGALTALNAAIELTTNGPQGAVRGAPLSLYYHERAKVHQVLGNAAAAVEDFTRVLKRQPNNLHALIRRAFALKAVGLFEEASQDWRKASQLDVSGAVSNISSREFYETKYVELCKPGNEEEDDTES